LPHPSLYVGDFNRQHVSWGYNKTSPDAESLDSGQHPTTLGCCITQTVLETSDKENRRQRQCLFVQVTEAFNLFFFAKTFWSFLTEIFWSLKHFSHLSHSTIVLKLTTEVFFSLYFQTL